MNYFDELVDEIENCSSNDEFRDIERSIDWGKLSPYESSKLVDILNKKIDYFRGGPSPLGNPNDMDDIELANYCHGSDDD